MKIYISSVAFLDYNIEKLIKICSQKKINLEFSSGMNFHPNMMNFFINYPYPKLAHNYFPAPQIPFVLNLASTDDNIRETSIQHCINGLQLTKKANAPFFAAHAGFCIDPNPNDLGKKLDCNIGIINKEYHWKLFIKSVNTILSIAEKLDTNFYIENNVIAKFNIDSMGQNPLLGCDDLELTRLVQEINHNRFGILLDTAHLKVSSNTLGFNMDKAVKNLKNVIKAVHHSDNDGNIDSNDPITNDYWFLKHFPQFRNLVHVIEVKRQSVEELKIQQSILSNHSI